MKFIKVTDHTKRCYSNEDGMIIHDVLLTHLSENESVNLSFQGIHSVTSSFINSALIELLDHFDISFIRDHLTFSNSSGQINVLINTLFKYETYKHVT